MLWLTFWREYGWVSYAYTGNETHQVMKMMMMTMMAMLMMMIEEEEEEEEEDNSSHTVLYGVI